MSAVFCMQQQQPQQNNDEFNGKIYSFVSQMTLFKILNNKRKQPKPAIYCNKWNYHKKTYKTRQTAI